MGVVVLLLHFPIQRLLFNKELSISHFSLVTVEEGVVSLLMHTRGLKVTVLFHLVIVHLDLKVIYANTQLVLEVCSDAHWEEPWE